MQRCFNCYGEIGEEEKVFKGLSLYYLHAHSSYIPKVPWCIPVSDWLCLCDDCINSIFHCASCGKHCRHELEIGNAHFRVSPASEPINPMAWPLKSQPELYGAIGKTNEQGSPIPELYLVRIGKAKRPDLDPNRDIPGVEYRLTLGEVHQHYGTRPVNRDLIIADCESCVQAKRELGEIHKAYDEAWEAHLLYGNGSPGTKGVLDFDGLLKYTK